MMKLTSEHNHRIVIKVGSALLVDTKQHALNLTWLSSLVDDIAKLQQAGCEVVLVTSGSIALGKIQLGLADKTLTLAQKQAAAAVGQIALMQHYQAAFAHHNLRTAQVLLTLDDTEVRSQFINLRNTLNSLLEFNIVPIINENDSVATSEIRYGDNDRLSARAAQLVDADTLILLSDIDGFYSDNPHLTKNAEFIPVIKKLTPDILAMAKDSHSNVGSGGMKTKLAAAKIAMSTGYKMLITNGRHLHPISHFQQSQRGTWFLPNTTTCRKKKSWIQEHLNPAGELIIDQGAATALHSGGSLLPVGILSMTGEFQKGAAITILNHKKEAIARGLVNYAHYELADMIDDKTKASGHVAIHRNNLALLVE